MTTVNNMTVLDEFALEVSLEKNKIIEEHIFILLKPKSKYLPEFIWNFILRRILVIATK